MKVNERSWSSLSSENVVRYRNLTFQNGESISASNSWIPALGIHAATFFDCNILSCQTSAYSGYETTGRYAIIYYGNLYNCYLDGLVSLSAVPFTFTFFNSCEMTNFKFPRNVININGAINCRFHHSNGMMGWGFNFSNNFAYNCIFHNLSAYTSILYRAKIGNCTLVNNQSNRYFWHGNGGAAERIVNNIFFNNKIPANRWFIQNYTHQTRNTIIANNITDVNASRFARVSADSTTSGLFIISDNKYEIDDVKFKDISANDFHLMNDSPAISAGLSSYLYTTEDIEGKRWNDAPAAGAYEYEPEEVWKNIPNKVNPL